MKNLLGIVTALSFLGVMLGWTLILLHEVLVNPTVIMAVIQGGHQ